MIPLTPRSTLFPYTTLFRSLALMAQYISDGAVLELMAQQGWEMIRYADDFIILCASAEQAQAALATVRQWMEQAGLTDRKSTRLNSSHRCISYAVFCLKKKI